jgi:hypothetical protein
MSKTNSRNMRPRAATDDGDSQGGKSSVGQAQCGETLAEAGVPQETAQGVPLWDWYAGQALNGILAGPDADPHWDYTALAVEHANKMMKARKGVNG